MKTLKTVASLFVLAFVCVGCVSYSRTAPDGTKITARGMFMQVGSIDSSDTGTNGVIRHMKLEKLSPDAESIKAVAEGVAKGLAEGAK